MIPSASAQRSAYSSRQLVKDIFVLLKPYRWRFIGGSLIRLVGDLAWLYPAFALSGIVSMLTRYKAGDSLHPIWWLLAGWAAAVLLRTLSQLASKNIGYRIAERLSVDSTLRTIAHLFRLDMGWHERENAGNKIKRVQNAGDGFNKILRLWFDNIVEITVNLVAINIIISTFDRAVLAVLIAFLITYFFISQAITRKAGSASYQVNEQEERVSGLIFEAVNNIRTVSVMAMAESILLTLKRSTDLLLKKLGSRIFWYQSRSSFAVLWAGGFRVVIIAMIVYGIVNHRYDIGFLILFNSYFHGLRESIDELAAASVDFVSSKYSIARMKEILNQPITIDDEAGKSAMPIDWKTISVRHVSFSYGNHNVLDDLTFDVHRGQRVGIVGLSGAGKSTLFKLLLKEREGFTGDILIDGASIKTIRRSDYLQQVSVVLQDTEVFNISLRDNITMINPAEKSNKRLLDQSLTIAHMDDVIKKLPNGVDTVIGEKGVKLSGGQRQRLGIARAVFKQPQILFLDEATSHLDLESEQHIRDSLHQFFEHVTAIVIAHRLTTIREMDNIILIERGKVVESGNFKKLTAKRGRFYQLWNKQKF